MILYFVLRLLLSCKLAVGSGITPKSIFLIFKHRDVIVMSNEYNNIRNKKIKQLSNFTSHVIQDGRPRHIYWEFGKHDLQTSSGYNEMKN